MRIRLASIVAAWCLVCAPGWSDTGPGLEQQLRAAFMLAEDVTLSFAGEDGEPISREEFTRRLEGGREVVIDKEDAGQAAVLRLKAPVAAASGPTHLPAVDLTDLSGRRIRNQDLAGKPTLVNFFFETCVPCIKEAPVLSAFARKHPEYNYLAVTFESREAARRFVDQRELQWPVVADAQAFVDAAGVKAYPTYLLVSPDGRILGRGSGMDPRSMNDVHKALAEFEAWVGKAAVHAGPN
jgi:thiol-disulfide isomerase/thioredoxin